MGCASSRYTIQDPAMHDSCINYANMLTLYRDKSCKRDMQRPGFFYEENKLDKRSYNSLTLSFSLLNFLMKIIEQN